MGQLKVVGVIVSIILLEEIVSKVNLVLKLK